MKEFYYGLNNSGVIIFWSVIFLFFFFLFAIIALLIKNKELKKRKGVLKKQLEEEKIKYELLEKKFIESKNSNNENRFNKEEDIATKKEIETNNKKEIKVTNIPDNIQKNINIKDISKAINNELESEKKVKDSEAYKKDFKPTSYQTSPINIKKNTNIKVSDNNSLNEGLNDSSNKSTNINSFVEEVSKNLEEANVPTTIELTDYEKKQEEEAIISYKELLENKDKLYNITDDEENIDFLEELKSFRSDL